jgi:flagellar biosynthesis protein
MPTEGKGRWRSHSGDPCGAFEGWQAVARSNNPSWGETDRPVAAALTYDPTRPGVPRVSAAGRGPIAEQILALAQANGVPVHEDPDLAGLLAAVEIDCEIPVEALVAVAEILAYVYRANGRLSAILKQGTQRP